ncbi:MAG: GNAT family N-acetyltransferase [Candidatus Tectomicrobia bacterium]|uniref:GNAT family N-acetyltransferase n=1 Tax=Tectimicrobiota bacterium TaxID=2528274 RepID=A0A933GMJ9_UNCTE|nr:GNAT family N-acetyltransferase [Candidatus Tectomicrobia bacterium]
MKFDNQELVLKDGHRVAIIGGGPGGSSCAIKLLRESKKRGLHLEVLVLEGKDFDFHYNQCVGVLSPPIERLLKDGLEIELPENLINRKIFGYRLHSYNNHILLVGSNGHEPTYTIRRIEFDRFLLETAASLGAKIIRCRVDHVEFLKNSHHDEVRIYHEGGFLKADIAVGAFGLDETMLLAWEKATKNAGGYQRPRKVLTSFITKIPIEETYLDRKLGSMICAFLLPTTIPGIEFGAITPKKGEMIVNVAGEKISSIHLDAFLSQPEVKKYLPELDLDKIEIFRGHFPTAPAKNVYGHRYVTIGDATGWVRPFKGKGINTAIFTGIQAAETMLKFGISGEAFKNYEMSCKALLDDYLYGAFVRHLCKFGSRLFLPLFIELAKVDPLAYEALFNSVSGHDSYKNILHHLPKWSLIQKFFTAFIKSKLPIKKSRSIKMENIKVRQLLPSDINSVIEIDKKITEKQNEGYWEAKLANYLSREPGACFAALDGDRVIGFVLGDIRGWEYAVPFSGWLEVIGVDPEYRGLQVGKLLIDTLFAYFQSKEVKAVHTMVNWNEGDLVDYFRAHGFERGEYINLTKKLD